MGIIRSIVPSLWVLRKVRLNLLVIEILFLMFGLKGATTPKPEPKRRNTLPEQSPSPSHNVQVKPVKRQTIHEIDHVHPGVKLEGAFKFTSNRDIISDVWLIRCYHCQART